MTDCRGGLDLVWTISDAAPSLDRQPNQVPISSHRKLLLLKAMVVNVAETSGQDPDRLG